jgi:hypothetical protein
MADPCGCGAHHRLTLFGENQLFAVDNKARNISALRYASSAKERLGILMVSTGS